MNQLTIFESLSSGDSTLDTVDISSNHLAYCAMYSVYIINDDKLSLKESRHHKGSCGRG